MATRIILAFILTSISWSLQAGSATNHNEPNMDISIEKLDRINYLPSLLPVIFKHKDFIGLTDEQVNRLEDWRKENREPMLSAMKEIAQMRIDIKQAALSPTVSSARLQQMQNEIFRLQRKVLDYKLACRDRVVRTFNNENWISFFMVLADEDIGVSVPVDFAEK